MADPTAPVTGDLRDQIDDVITDWCSGSEREVEEIVNAVMARLVSLADPGDLPQRMAAAMRAARDQWVSPEGETNAPEVGEHFAIAAMSVRWETAIQAYAAAGEAIRRERYAVAEHKGTQERLAEARRELAQYRARLAARITDEVGLSWQELLDRAEQLRVERDAAERTCAMAERAAQRWHDDYGRILAERDAANATITRVRELRDRWYRHPGMSEEADALDAALDASGGTESEDDSAIRDKFGREVFPESTEDGGE